MDERELLTPERVKADLIYDIKCERIDCIMCTIMFALIFGMLFLPTLLAGDKTGITAIDMVMLVILLLFASFLAVMWIRVVREMRLVKNGGFKIVNDTLNTVSEDEFMERNIFDLAKIGYRDRGRMFHIHHRINIHIEDAFYFSKYGRVHAEKNISAFSMKGDEFYLVIYPDYNDLVVRTYSARLYRK